MIKGLLMTFIGDLRWRANAIKNVAGLVIARIMLRSICACGQKTST